MLVALSLRDFVIVESLNLDISAGFTVLTGETGAGKSILIDAIELLLGGRADSSLVREGAERTNIIAEFSLSDRAKEWLRNNELLNDEDTLLIRRVVDVKGRSKAWVNGITVTVTQLRELSETLIDVYGQHAYQSLLKPAYQLKLLDDHVGASEALSLVQQNFIAWKNAQKILEEASENTEVIAEKAQRLEWMIGDLERLAPKEKEWETLSNDHQRLAHAVVITEGLSEVQEMLTQGEISASHSLTGALSKLRSLSRYDDKLNAVNETLLTAVNLVEETSQDVARYLDRHDFDSETFESLDQRVSLYFELARKFRVEPEELFAFLNKLKAEFKALKNTKNLDELAQQEARARLQYQKSAQSLSLIRQKGAQQLSEAVTAQMQLLAMKGARLEISLSPAEPSMAGSDHCEFLIAGHTGVQPRSLIRVASGGELARVSLAIAVITAQATPVPTLIFDEVDSGIGGAVAEVVGALLKRLGGDRQVLCVTHLPQVAAYGDQHWRVEKHQREHSTLSDLKVLTPDERVQEVARMLAGISITENTLSVAREMLQHEKSA